MSGDGAQITIPDFDDDDNYAPPSMFGKPQGSTTSFGSGGGNAFGSSGAAFGHAAPSWGGLEPDSPTTTSTPMPMMDRKPSYFHSRNDSSASMESSISGSGFGSTLSNNGAVGTISRAPPIGTANPKISAGTPGPTKKSSFASLKSAFAKAGKSSDAAPPLPPLKNPFNRSTTSLAGSSATSRRPSVTTTPATSIRPGTPSSGDNRYTRTLSSKPKSHQYVRSFQSQSGAAWTETSGEFGFGNAYRSSSPPPVPPVPATLFGQSNYPEEPVGLDPRTPSDYALHAVFMRFATMAETKIDQFLRKPLESEPRLDDSLGPGQDPKFDDLLTSLGKIAQKHLKPVVDSVMRWRKSQNDGVPTDIIREHVARAAQVTRSGGHQRQASNVRPQAVDPSSALNHRKVLASIYIMCRALICIVQAMSSGGSKDGLAEATGLMLEETTFDQFRRPDLKLLSQSSNHRINSELYSKLLGELADVRFISVTDRFISELTPVASGQVLKDTDMRYEMLLRGLRHVNIKVYPPEKFEEGAEFMEALCHSFEHAHGATLKITFAETLTRLLHPIGKTAQAEVNHPLWAKAIEVIYTKAKDMMSKPRYWPVAYPLVITSLCVAPQDYFLKNWLSCFDAGFSKLKEKQYRVPVMNGMIRLLWMYLFRCPEQASVATSKLDTLLKKFFPANGTVFPSLDDRLEPFSYMLHFLLVRHPEFGTDLVAEFLHEGTLLGAASVPPAGQSISNIVSAERFAIAVQATLFTVHGVEKDQVIPSWPSSSDFSIFPAANDYSSSSGLLAETALDARPAIQDLLDRVKPLVSKVASWCKASVGRMTIFDDQWSIANHPNVQDETLNLTIRRHGDINVCFPMNLLGQMHMLQTCFQAWPRLLDGSVPLAESVDELLLGVLHVEPAIAMVASPALQRLLEDPERGSAALSRVHDFLFDTMHKTKEGSGVRSPVESKRLVGLWVAVVEDWTQRIIHMDIDGEVDEAQRKDLLLRLDEIETGALLLLSHETPLLHAVGVKVIRALAPLLKQDMLFRLYSHASMDDSDKPTRIIHMLLDNNNMETCLSGFDDHLDTQTLGRLEYWRKSSMEDVLLRISEGNNVRDRLIWKFVYPNILKVCAGLLLRPITRLQDLLIGSAARLQPFIQSVSAPRQRMVKQPGVPDKEVHRLGSESVAIIHQWAMWERMICAMSGTHEARQAFGHARGPSDLGVDRDSMHTPRGLYKYLAQFLESEHAILRSTAAMCISLLPAQTYYQLLEDLSLLAARHFHDETRSKTGSSFVSRAHYKEDLYTAVARIYYLTAHFLQDPRLPSRQAVLAHVLKFVRQTQTFLAAPEIRNRYPLQRLRRYFCGTVEKLFDGLASLKDSDRFVPPNMHLSLYRLVEEWCQFGAQSTTVKQRLVDMQTKAASTGDSPQMMADNIERFQTQTKKLSRASVHTLASLCHKAYFPPEIFSDSPTDRQDQLRPLDPASTLDRITSILASFDDPIRAGAQKALRLLLAHDTQELSLAEETMRRAFVTTTDPGSSNARFFEIVANVIIENETHAFTFSQVVCLCWTNLCHPAAEIRRHAFRALNAIHRRSTATISLGQYEAGIQSLSPGIYLYAYRQITDVLADSHPAQSGVVLAQITGWIPRIAEGGYDRLPLLLLQSLEYWVANLNLMTQDTVELSAEGGEALLHLMTLTVRYVDVYAEQITAMWTRLLDAPHQHNGHATIRFLLEQSQKVGSPAFISCSAKVIACLCNTSIGMQLFNGLCGVIEPARILPNVEHRLTFPDAGDADLWSSLDVLFGDEQRLLLGTGQFALLFLSDVALERPWENSEPLPTLLHAIFTHLDHRHPHVQQRARHMLIQVLRAWMPAYEELDLDVTFPIAGLQSELTALEGDLADKLWTDEDAHDVVLGKMKRLCSRVLALIEPLFPTFAAQWGSLALTWATGCAVRSIAFRSLQLFRAILPPVSQDDLGILVGRLSNTIAGEDEQLQSYSVEILTTLTALCATPHIDVKLLPQTFWCACACLSTTVEQEFIHAVALVNVLMDRLDLNDPLVEDMLLSSRPPGWRGPASLQPAILTGLRSSVASTPAFDLLRRLSDVTSNRLIDPSGSRMRDVYTMVLPWCLQDMTSEPRDPVLSTFATRIAELADADKCPSISRIMTSFVKARFRTKDDFLRQSVLSLREHFSTDSWGEVVTLLISLVLNGEKWLRQHTLQILKVLFQQKTAKNPVDLLGSELLMPLLRLVDSDVASQALEVLEEPMAISGGLAAKHVLRMSMQIAPSTDEINSQGEVYGIPQDSGWCVPKVDEARMACRANVEAVFDTCKSNMRPSRIHFHPEIDLVRQQRRVTMEDLHEDVGDLVQDLHELSSFFQRESLPPTRRAAPPGQVTMPTQSNVARWTAILAKSTENPADMPQTPFLDVFRVHQGQDEDFSDESAPYSDSDGESDLFYFDSPAFLNGRTVVNGDDYTNEYAVAHDH